MAADDILKTAGDFSKAADAFLKAPEKPKALELVPLQHSYAKGALELLRIKFMVQYQTVLQDVVFKGRFMVF